MDDWAKVSSALDETSALPTAVVPRDAGVTALVRRGAVFEGPDSISAGPGGVLVPEPALAEVRQPLAEPTGRGS